MARVQSYGHGEAVLEIQRDGEVVDVITRPNDDLGVVVSIPRGVFNALVTEMNREED